MNDQAQQLRNLVRAKQFGDGAASADGASRGESRTIAVTSGKGGVGKTNLTVNLAIALARKGQRVLVIDADLGMANVDVVLGSSSAHSLLDLTREDIGFEDVLSEGPAGIRYVSGGSGLEKLANLEPEDFFRISAKLCSCESLADIVLIDTGAGLGKNVLNFLLAADEVILLTTPEPTAMTDAYAIMKAYSVYADRPHMHLVVNRVFDDVEGKSVFTKLIKTAERFLDLTVLPLGEIYEDRNVVRAIKAQTPLLVAYPQTIASRCIQAVAENLLDGGYVVVSRGLRGFLEKFLKFL